MADAAYQREWVAKQGPGYWRRATVKSKYNLDGDQLAALEARFGNLCGICGSPATGGRSLHIDHDHSCCPGSKSCGKCIRGLLCFDCNKSLGHFGDDVKGLRRAIAYLETRGPVWNKDLQLDG